MVLELAKIAATLESLEETIIFKLIDRAQFKQNRVVYQPGKSGFADEPTKSLFMLRLWYQECMDALFGRFLVPEERPFHTDLPAPKRQIHLPDTGLALRDYQVVSLTDKILQAYIELIPALCSDGDDGQYGSSIEHDVYALQAIARRIHYGALFIAESKYREDPQGYADMIAHNDREGLMRKLTRREVEEKIMVRVKEKVDYVQNQVNPALRMTINPDVVLRLYRDTIIPLTKEGEVAYLLHSRHD
jgi:chorismate mutase